MAEEEKDSFVMHRSFLSGIPEEEQFKWFKIICDFAFDGVEPQFKNWYEEKIFENVKTRIKADKEAYELKKERNRQRQAEWRKKNGVTVTNVSNACHTLSHSVTPCHNLSQTKNVTLNTNTPSVSDIDSVFDSDIDIVSDIDIGIDIDSVSDSVFEREGNKSSPAPAKKSFKKPTLEEIKAYMAEMNYTFDAGQFYDHYEANGWVQGKGKKITDWKAAVRNWNRREKEFSDPFYSNSATISGDKPQANYEYDDSDWGEAK